jgi:hypothetical protein
VREREEDHIVAAEGFDGRLVEHPVGEGHEVRLECTERLARVGGAREGTDLHVGMAEEQAQQLAPGVPTGSGDGDPGRHVHDYTVLRMFM